MLCVHVRLDGKLVWKDRVTGRDRAFEDVSASSMSMEIQVFGMRKLLVTGFAVVRRRVSFMDPNMSLESPTSLRCKSTVFKCAFEFRFLLVFALFRVVRFGIIYETEARSRFTNVILFRMRIRWTPSSPVVVERSLIIKLGLVTVVAMVRRLVSVVNPAVCLESDLIVATEFTAFG